MMEVMDKNIQYLLLATTTGLVIANLYVIYQLQQVNNTVTPVVTQIQTIINKLGLGNL